MKNDVRVSTMKGANERWECNSWPWKNERVEGGAETMTLTISRLVIGEGGYGGSNQRKAERTYISFLPP
jgi:hypothetical protein